MDQAEETALVRRLVAMDEQAWTVFCKECSPPLLRFVQLSFRCGPEQAEEVVQMTFIRCVRSIRTFDSARGRLLGWLKAVARNEAHTYLKMPGKVSFNDSSVDVAAWLTERIDRTPLSDDALARQDVQLLVADTLALMNGRQRDVLVAKYIEGLKVAEIAAKMNASEKTVESLLSRARESFRAIVASRSAGRPDDRIPAPRYV
jgi:RNA polymerase sigma-70 factor (ECF subfamily)